MKWDIRLVMYLAVLAVLAGLLIWGIATCGCPDETRALPVGTTLTGQAP
ncbi:hypothetical protein [Streptomyces sp. 049-1]